MFGGAAVRRENHKANLFDYVVPVRHYQRSYIQHRKFRDGTEEFIQHTAEQTEYVWQLPSNAKLMQSNRQDRGIQWFAAWAAIIGTIVAIVTLFSTIN